MNFCQNICKPTKMMIKTSLKTREKKEATGPFKELRWKKWTPMILERKIFIVMMRVILCELRRGSRLCRCMRSLGRKLSGVSFIECMDSYYFYWGRTSWLYLCIKSYARLLDSLWLRMLRSTNSKMKRLMFIGSFEWSFWAIFMMRFLGNLRHRLQQWLSMLVKLLWASTRYIIDPIGLLQGSQCTNYSQKMQLFTSIKFNVFALKINYYIQMNH